MVRINSVGAGDVAPVQVGVVFKHYYDFVPDRLDRPPISLLA
jgi:hypothetical protein